MNLAAELRRDFGIEVSALQGHPGGFGSRCWVGDDTWFVKMWKDGARPGGLEMLAELRGLGLPVVASVRGRDGADYAMHARRAYAVFPYVQGRTATPNDWLVTARALRHVHEVKELPSLPPADMDEPAIRALVQNLDHPWIVDRGDEVAAAAQRLEQAIDRASAKSPREVICHRDFGGLNLILDDAGEVAAILDWEQAVVGPREHDVWIAAEGNQLEAFLDEYGAHDLDLDHLEYALLARALRDLAARVLDNVDRPGVDTWGFDRIARLDSDLEVFSAYCR